MPLLTRKPSDPSLWLWLPSRCPLHAYHVLFLFAAGEAVATPLNLIGHYNSSLPDLSIVNSSSSPSFYTHTVPCRTFFFFESSSTASLHYLAWSVFPLHAPLSCELLIILFIASFPTLEESVPGDMNSGVMTICLAQPRTLESLAQSRHSIYICWMHGLSVTGRSKV